MLEVINGEELANDREAWRGVVIATKGLNSLYLANKKKIKIMVAKLNKNLCIFNLSLYISNCMPNKIVIIMY